MSSYDTSRPSKKDKIIKEMQEENKLPPSHITIKLEPELKRRFKSIASSQGYNMTDIVADFVKKYVEEWKKNEKN